MIIYFLFSEFKSWHYMGKRCEWDVNTFSAEWSISWWVSWRGEGGIDGRYIFGQAEKDGFRGEMGVGGGSPFKREKTRLYCATKFVNFIWAFRTVKQPVFSSQRKSKHFISCTTRHSPVYEMRIYADQHKVQLLLLSRKIYGKEKSHLLLLLLSRPQETQKGSLLLVLTRRRKWRRRKRHF